MDTFTAFPADYKTYLTDALSERQLRNPNYSLRAYSRDLGMGVSTLSELLKGKYGLSKARIEQVAKALELSPSQKEHFRDLIEAEHARTDSVRKDARTRIQSRLKASGQSISLDSFKVIADWYHMAILELFETDGFSDSPKWLSERLGIPEETVQRALERLERLEMLEKTSKGLRPTHEFTAIGGDIPSQAIRRFHKQVLEKALAAIEVQAASEREYSSTVFAIDKKNLAKAKQRLLEFRREFGAEFSKGSKKNDVFVLGIQFFSLLKKGTQL